MKKHKIRTLVLRKEIVQQLSSTKLRDVAGGAPSILAPSACPAQCLTVRTCASVEFSC